MTFWPSGRAFDWRNLGVRLVSALVLAPAAIGAAWVGSWVFLLMVGVGSALLAIEWALMSAPETPTRMAAVITVAVVAAVCTLYAGHPVAAWIVALIGAAAAALVALPLKSRTGDAAFGVLYLATPALALMWLRLDRPSGVDDGLFWTILVLTTAWAADSAAFLVGSVLRGPKLWPRFSPNKTWSGFVGGLVAGAAAAWGVAELTGVPYDSRIALGAGLLCAFATMAGDLLESMLKRRFGVKDSGALIPGHGGLLDRIDGLMTAIVVMAGVRLGVETGAFAWL